MAYTRNMRRGMQARKVQRNTRASRHPVRDWYASVNWERFRFSLAGLLFLFLWLVLWGRAAQIQLFDNSLLAERARRQHTRVEMVTGQRGLIYDRNGQVLARNVECRSVYANPREIDNKRHTAAVLAEILDLQPESIERLLSRDRAFIWIARKIDDAAALALRKAALPGIGLIKEYERVYPFKQAAGQLLGFTDIDNLGREGLESAFNESLSGVSTKRIVRRDAAGRRLYQHGEDVPSGKDLHLTIDVHLQFMAEEALAEVVKLHEARWGGALVVDVKSGDVLTWAQYPFFNPNNYRGASPAQYRNRLALDALEPGSTLKPIMLAAALQEGVVTRDTLFHCENGVWKTAKTVIRDDSRSYGELPVHQILSVSSNIGSAKIGLKLGAAKYHRYLNRLGFGQRVGLHVAESRGILHRIRDWSETDIMSISFGQGMAATAIQMAQAYLTIGNGGVYKPLRLVQEIENRRRKSSQDETRRIFSEKVSHEVLRMMREVVEEGTGKRAAISGVSVAGKTGTAQKADKRGTYGEQRTASFVGFVPADKPRYLVIILIDEPQNNRYGGIIAAPVFKNVMSRTLAYHGLPVGMQVAEKEIEENKEGQKKRAVIFEPVIKKAATQVPDKVPDVLGKSVRQAVEMFVSHGIVPELRGEGQVVVRQNPVPGSDWHRSGAKQDEAEYILWISEK